MKKKCSKCGLVKSIGEFSRYGSNNPNPRPACKSCYQVEQKVWRDKNRPKVNEQSKMRMRGYTPDPRKRLAAALKHRYGMTLEDWDSLMEAQGGVCAICGGGPTNRTRLDVDHLGPLVRGLLCGPCNRMLAQGRDNPETLRAGARYLESV